MWSGLGCAVLGATVVGAAAPALAGPAVRVDGLGLCPSPGAVEARVGAWADVDGFDAQSWQVFVDREGPRARLDLIDPAGAVRVTREIESDDCEALAAAFDVIVRAHLEALPAPAVELAPAPAPAAALDAPGTSSAPADQRAWWAAVMGGAHYAGDAGGLARLEAGAVRGLWRLGAGLGAPMPLTQQGAQMQRVRTAALDLELAAGPSFGGARWYVHPALGLGARAASVTALDLASAPATMRWQPKAGAALALGGHVAGSMWLRAAVAADVFLRSDIYEIEPIGAIARSPRAAVSVAVGLEIRFSDRGASLGPRTGGPE